MQRQRVVASKVRLDAVWHTLASWACSCKPRARALSRMKYSRSAAPPSMHLLVRLPRRSCSTMHDIRLALTARSWKLQVRHGGRGLLNLFTGTNTQVMLYRLEDTVTGSCIQALDNYITCMPGYMQLLILMDFMMTQHDVAKPVEAPRERKCRCNTMLA